MASDTPHPIIFVVPGAQAALDGAVRGAAAPAVPAGLARGRIKKSVRIAAQRGAGVETRVEAIPGEDVVVLHIADGPSLVLHPETARDLMLAQGEPKPDRGARGTPVVTDEVPVPLRLRWRGLEESLVTRGAARGALGEVIATGLDIVAGLVKDPAADLVATTVVKRVDAQVDPGVYRLDPATLSPLKGSGRKVEHVPAASGPILVLIHGTFVETTRTFGVLWSRHPQLVRCLFEHYRDRVYALEHATLGASPIANALTLVRALPDGACLHLVTHSRGGLVAEVLARVCAAPALAPEDRARFAGRSDARDLEALAALVAKKAIRVYRVVRVACPARGTLLASKRLDAYLSVFKWTLELAGVPIAPAFVDFLGEVALRRSDPALLPGLEAQIPDSALLQWLHDVDELVPGELKVVAGDIEGDSVTSWLKTLLADAFYWTDNDLVVHTRSMYGGAPRAAGATFLLARGGDVSHFTYFANELTAEAIVNALVQEVPAGFRTIGPLSWAGQSSTGYRAPTRGDTAAASAKPAVFLLPGILGSNLKVDGKRIWLGWRLVNGLARLEYGKVQPDGVEPDGALENTYDELVAFLAATHDVIEFDFDWRRPLEVEARRLGTAVDKALALREANGQPVRLLAHSMGGLLARTMQLECPDVWARMMARAGARLLMLGTPNGGSWAPMQVLSGDDTFGNLLVAFGAPFRDHAARKMMAGLPGFLQLQRGLGDPASGLDQQATWKRLADADLAQVQQYNAWHRDTLQLMPYKWGVPTQGVLDQAVALRRRLDAQVRDALPSFSDKMLLVAGKARFTPDGFEVNEEGLVYRDAVEGGDGRVTLESALLPGVATWQIDCEHGKLPQERTAFDGYLDLLRSGDTNRLPRLAVAGAERGAPAPAHVPSRPSREQPLPTPPENAREVGAVGAAAPRERVPKDVPLRVSVTNGDLMFVRAPMLVGHYRSSRLTGTERAVDRLVGGGMAASLRVGVYPEPVGSQEIFVNARRDPENPWRMPRPEAVIVVGLGEEGKLSAADLAFTVRQGVLEWARRLVESGAPPPQFEIAATLIGSGGTGVSPGQAAQLLAQGVRDANAEIARENQRQETDRTGAPRAARIAWPRVAHLDLIELYLDRAGEAWRALQVLASAAPGRYRVGDVVLSGVGGLERPADSSYRGADYDFITAITRNAADGSQEVAYTMDTRRARSEVRAQKAQVALLRELVRDASNAGNRDPRIGRTLFQLLIPLELEPFLGGTTDMVLELDEGTAVIPWELLDTDSGARGVSEQRPWAIRSKLLRKLRTERFRARVSDAGTEASVLVIGEPRCDVTRYPPLPGAHAEAKAVCDLLAGSAGLAADRVRKLIGPDGVENGGPDARAVIDALLERNWRIVHVAGHGQPPELAPGAAAPVRNGPNGPPSPGGVVLSGGVFLGANEIRTMRIVPELVFINCCHLAAMDERRLLDPYDRPEFAATVARELIEIGVRCVIAAGWAVDDEPAKTFATAFYATLLSGRRFIDAVALAREAAWRMGGNTWAAYQCYGDPDWVLNREQGGDLRPPPTPAEEFGGINCERALRLALDTICVRSKFRHVDSPDRAKRDRQEQAQKIGYLETRFDSLWGSSGGVAEAFARARADTGDLDKAIAWYERALRANDGAATLRASEQLGNLRVRLAESAVAAARRRRDELAQRAASDGKAASGRKQKKGARGKGQAKPDRELEAAQATLEKAIRAAQETIRDAIALLEQVRALRPTMERESLCGSAYKRLANIAADAGDARAEASAIARMAAHYVEAERLGRGAKLSDVHYPALNRIAAEVAANAGRARWPGLATATIAGVRSDLAARIRDDPDFWSVAGMTELDLYVALGKRSLARALPRLERDFDDLHNRVRAPWLWASVGDQAGFVLRRYAAGASQAERAAAASLLARLEAMARGG